MPITIVSDHIMIKNYANIVYAFEKRHDILCCFTHYIQCKIQVSIYYVFMSQNKEFPFMQFYNAYICRIHT